MAEQQQKEMTAKLRENNSEEIEIDLIELAYYFWAKIGYIAAGFVIAGLLSGLITYFFITPKYTGQAKLYMVSSSKGSVVDISDLNIGTNLSADYAQLIQTRPILEAVIDKLELDLTVEELLDMMNVTTISNTRILVLKVTSTDPMLARDITNAIADEAVTRLPVVMDTPEPHIAEEAILPEHKSSPSLTKNILIAALAGALAVMGVLTLFYILDDTLDTAEDVEKAFGLTPLTVVPEGDIGALGEDHEKKRRHRSRLLRRLFRKSRKRKEGRS